MVGPLFKSALWHTATLLLAWAGLPALFDDPAAVDAVVVVEMVTVAERRNLPNAALKSRSFTYACEYECGEPTCMLRRNRKFHAPPPPASEAPNSSVSPLVGRNATSPSLRGTLESRSFVSSANSLARSASMSLLITRGPSARRASEAGVFSRVLENQECMFSIFWLCESLAQNPLR